MAVRRKGNQFQADFMSKGKRHRKSFNTETEAEAWELNARAAIKLGKPVPGEDEPVKARSLGGGDAGTMAGVMRAARKHWDATRKGSRGSIRNAQKFVDWVGPTTPPHLALTKEKVKEFLEVREREHRNAKPTLNRFTSSISVLRKAAGIPHFEMKWHGPDWSRARKKFFSELQERQVIALLTQWGYERERDLFIFLNDTGLRPWAEAKASTWDQYDESRGRMMLMGVIGKSGLLRDVPVTSRAAAAVWRQDRTGRGPWAWANEYTLNPLWERVRAAIPGLEGTVWYTCRHTFASRLIQGGCSYGNVAQLMDNSVEIIRRVYGHLAPEDMHREVSVLDKYGEREVHLSLVKTGQGG